MSQIKLINPIYFYNCSVMIHFKFKTQPKNKPFFQFKPIEVEFNDKVEFRNFCSMYTPYIKNIELPTIKKQTLYEAVLIEFRILPHLEFLIRNTILKLNSDWCHTIICGNLNYSYMVELCNSISPNINVIRVNHDNLNRSTYSILLASIDFWNLLQGTKILIYQEDSIIFKQNMNDFIKWDYVGAPWPKYQNDTISSVGNGGFSLRTKQCMMDVIHKKDIHDMPIENKNYGDLYVCPEDVYFCKTMEDYNIGTIPDWNTASNFSTEAILNLDSCGGHNFWLCDPNWKERLYQHNIIQFMIPQEMPSYFNEHRGGWKTIMDHLHQQQLYRNTNHLFYDMLDLQFIFKEDTIITKKWCGIFHCTPKTPPYLNIINIHKIFMNKNFLSSLQHCKAIITLSDYLSSFFEEKFKLLNINVNVYTLKHPVITNVPKFNYASFLNNKNKRIIQIGQQLRKVSSIYVMPPIQKYSKMWLTGTKDFKKLKRFLHYEISLYQLNININEIPMVYLNSYRDYDGLLTKNVVFIDLFDASANNTVVECIVRNTPLVVNKIPGVVNYLGNEYPLYYHDLNEIPGLLTEENLLKAHQYLVNMDKHDLEIKFFTKKLMTLLYNLFNGS